MKVHPSALAEPGTALGVRHPSPLVEAIVLIFESGDEMVIHAMPARKKYLELLP